MQDYGFLTMRGEERISFAMSGIIRDVNADRLTRKAALRLIADVLEAVSGIDGESIGEENIEAIVQVLKPSFANAGFKDLTVSEVAEFRQKIRQDVSRIAFADLPEGQKRVSVACQDISIALSGLEALGWSIRRHGEHSQHGITLTIAKPEDSPWSNREQIWGVLIGSTQSSCWIDMFGALSSESPQKAHERFLALFPDRRTSIEKDIMALKTLTDAMQNLNEAILMCDANIRLELDINARPSLFIDGKDMCIEEIHENEDFSPLRF